MQLFTYGHILDRSYLAHLIGVGSTGHQLWAHLIIRWTNSSFCTAL